MNDKPIDLVNFLGPHALAVLRTVCAEINAQSDYVKLMQKIGAPVTEPWRIDWQSL